MWKLTRRGWLVLGGLGLVVSAACPARAGTSAEIEGGAYGGTGAGSWACGLSNAKVKYGGVGVRGQVWLNQPEPAPEAAGTRRAPEGLSIGGGLSGEIRKYTLTGCNPSSEAGLTELQGKPCTNEFYPLPSDGVYGGAVLFVGYDRPLVGGRLGAIGYLRSKEPESTDDRQLRGPKKIRFWPEATLRVGSRTGLHGELGTGSYSFDNVMRPAVVYAGLLWATPVVDLALRVGQHEVFDNGQEEVRADLSARFNLTESLRLGLGGGVFDGLGGLHPHGRLLFGAAF